MESKKEHINNKVTETLQQLDNIDKIEASPFFETKLEAKIQGLEKEKTMFSFLFSPGYNLKPVFIGLLLVINIVSISLVAINNIYNSSYNDEISILIEDYAFDQTDYYVLTQNGE